MYYVYKFQKLLSFAILNYFLNISLIKINLDGIFFKASPVLIKGINYSEIIVVLTDQQLSVTQQDK